MKKRLAWVGDDPGNDPQNPNLQTGGFEMSAGKIKELIRKNDQLGRLLGVELTDVSEGRAYAELTVKKEHLNAAGVCHGGSIFALADIALAAASNSCGQVALLTNGNIQVFHATQLGDTLIAKAKEVSASRKLAHYRVKVTNRAGDQIAVYNATVYKTSAPLPEA
ncbi:hotdog fold thioesterase [Tichowtungia aerotolerans]|uniref:Hotdog fold thioesterase n=1 Tax=Tichowtungia aerotolerans TaxID=2697043 RepID=A0A6P1MBU5_9BACT|nr:hotdog fold thioesterase [Tichowtungia aerotolerans]QHI70573.1 hotdog fold thioesterase [Tichowtungia aerotolerans]